MLHSASAQYRMLEDVATNRLVKQAIDSIYNLNFEAADNVIEVLDNKLGEYPGNYLLKAFYTSWKFRPLKSGEAPYQHFESHLNRAIELSNEMLKANKDDEEANFFLMAGHAFLAELYSENGQNLKALGEAKSAYKFVKIGFDQLDRNPEFYFSSGIYNYYRVKYPEEKPFYKPFMWVFKSGNKEEGLEMLKLGAEKAAFTRAECLIYLFHIYLRYEGNPQDALPYSSLLHQRYPNNLLFTSHFIENNFRLKQYAGLKPEIQKLLESKNDFFRYLGEIFYGQFLELHEKNYQEAMVHYNLADEIGEKKNCRVPHYDSILFLGMGRTNGALSNDEEMKKYLKRSIKSAEYQSYRADAQHLLSN